MHRYIPRLNCATGMLLIPCAAGACDAGGFFTPVVMQVLLGLSLFAAGIYRRAPFPPRRPKQRERAPTPRQPEPAVMVIIPRHPGKYEGEFEVQDTK